MSRVNKNNGQKWMNVSEPPYYVSGYEKAESLTQWLLYKKNWTYKRYRNQDKETRDRLREEYLNDTKEYRESGKTV